MGELKFASVDEALQHLSNITERRVKIAWEDESRQMMRDIAIEIQNSPGLLARLKKSKAFNPDRFFQEAGVDKDAKILPTSKKQLKIVQDFPKEAVRAVVDAISNIKDRGERAKIIDHVVDDEEFKVFHSKYPKGVQKDDSGPYYRGQKGMVERGLDKLMGEKGEEGEKDKVDREKLEEEKKAESKKVRELNKAVKDQVNAMLKPLPDTESKADFEILLKFPADPKAQKVFMESFEQDIKDRKVNKEDANTYVRMIKRMAKFADEKYGDDLPEYIKSLEALAKSVDEAEDDATAGPAVEKPEDVPGGDTEAQSSGGLVDQFGRPLRSSEFDEMINNIVNEWMSVKK